MYKTVVYALINGGITHKNSRYHKKVMVHSMTLLKCQCTAE